MAKQQPGQAEAPPAAAVIEMLMGAWVSQTVSAVTRLNIPDLLQEPGPQTALQLTRDRGVEADPAFLERAMRACASVGIFTEDEQGSFGPTALSEALTTRAPGSVKKLAELFGASWWKVWTGLSEALRTGAPQAKAQLGLEYWDYCAANPKEMEDFGEAMKANSFNSLRGVLEHCDLSGVKQVADIGGGFGHLAIALLKKYRELRGVVLDVPDLMPIAQKRLAEEEAEVTSRLEFVGGDMFAQVPAAEVYIMKHIIHDWDDARCIQLLKNCRTSMEGEGRVICVDAVLPPMGDLSGTAAKFLDLDMMVFIPGKERTRKQWEALFDAAGFQIKSITPLHDNFGTSIVEGVKR
jgi:cyclopropane fatty-acyl-phospholipid synthase-like methyltransferase